MRLKTRKLSKKKGYFREKTGTFLKIVVNTVVKRDYFQKGLVKTVVKRDKKDLHLATLVFPRTCGPPVTWYHVSPRFLRGLSA